MATTQYQVFCRYLNENSNRPLSNQTSVDWISAEDFNELEKFYNDNQAEYDNIVTQLMQSVIKENQLDVVQLNIYNTCKKYEETVKAKNEQKIVTEYCIVEPSDALFGDTDGSLKKAQAQRDLELYQYVIGEAKADNPKYDMVFMYDGIAYAESRTGESEYNPSPTNSKQVPYLYYDRMKRVKLDPWFLYSTHASLTAAMAKAKELVGILGKDAVKIGKVVPLDQYIKIV